MYEYSRSALKDGNLGHNGPYEAMVVSHLDRYYQGTLLVELIRHYGSSNIGRRTGQLMAVRYVSPFYGVTPADGLNDNDGYQNSQKSYGFWAVPPDFGTRVLVIFAESSGPYGYWIGCIQDANMNFMTPGGGSASTILTTDETPESLQGKKLPVGEYNKLIEQGERVNPTLFEKPYNKDFTEVLEVQGLLGDEIRGTTTSSARREIPSMVFGISTPGPLDKRKGHPKAKYGAAEEEAEIPFNRLGGSSFVMDDGDDKFVRATHAEDGPPIYLNREAGEQGGDETIPQNELMRFRTRTGHQILMHNSEDLIYIANSRGTAWLEFTSDGKIDIYAYDSISLHTDNDFNLSAERDINMEAGRNVNINASARWSDYNEIEQDSSSGTVRIEGAFNTDLFSGRHFKFQTEENFEILSNSDIMFTAKKNLHFLSEGNIFEESKGSIHQSANHSIYRYSASNINDLADGIVMQTAQGPIHRKSVADAIYDEAKTTHHIYAYENVLQYAAVNHEIKAGIDSKTTAGSNIHEISVDNFKTAEGNIHSKASSGIYSDSGASTYNTAGGDIYNDVSGSYEMQIGGEFHLDAANVYLNSGLSFPGEPAESGTSATTASTAIIARKAAEATASSGVARSLNSYTLPYVLPGSNEIIPFRTSIPRIPQHEPWPHHENLNPLAFKKHLTDIENIGNLTTADRVLTPDTFANGSAGVSTSVRLGGTGGNISTGTEGNEQRRSLSGGLNTPTTGAGPIPTSVSDIINPPDQNNIQNVPGTLPENITSRSPNLPRQNILDSISIAAKVVLPDGKLEITQGGGADERDDEGTKNHPYGHAADVQIKVDDDFIYPRDNSLLYQRLAEELIANANSRGVIPGIGWYNTFLHYDESPWRQKFTGSSAITWPKSQENLATVKTNVANNRRTLLDRSTVDIVGIKQSGFSNSNINSPSANSSGSGPGTENGAAESDIPVSSTEVPGDVADREQAAMNYFVTQAGFSAVQAAGIVGNLTNESAMNPTAVAPNDAGPGKDSEGLAQWNRERLANLKSFAQSKGAEYTDFNIQLAFVVSELQNDPYERRVAGVPLTSAVNVRDATVAMTKYERFKGYEQGVSSPETQERIADAERIFALFNS